jgi:transposase
MGRLFWLSDAQWSAVEPHLPRNQPGARQVDDRRVISGIIQVLRTGCRWRDCPAEYGPAHHYLQSLPSLVAPAR